MSGVLQKTHDADARLPIYPSMQACAAATGIPKPVMQQAKRSGCPAFDAGNRVHLEKLLKWLFRGQDDAETAIDWANRLKRAQALTAELDLDHRKGTLVDLVAVRERVSANAGRIKGVLTTALVSDLPARLAGRGAAEIQKAIEAALDKAYTELQKAAQ